MTPSNGRNIGVFHYMVARHLEVMQKKRDTVDGGSNRLYMKRL